MGHTVVIDLGNWHLSGEPTDPPCPIPKGAKQPRFLRSGKWVDFPH